MRHPTDRTPQVSADAAWSPTRKSRAARGRQPHAWLQAVATEGRVRATHGRADLDVGVALEGVVALIRDGPLVLTPPRSASDPLRASSSPSLPLPLLHPAERTRAALCEEAKAAKSKG
eukprot:1004326-Rhodomonas_salina.1